MTPGVMSNRVWKYKTSRLALISALKQCFEKYLIYIQVFAFLLFLLFQYSFLERNTALPF